MRLCAAIFGVWLLASAELAWLNDMGPSTGSNVIGGALPGSILPAGNWINGFSDSFAGNRVDTNKWIVPADGASQGAWGGTSNCASGGMTINNGLILYASYDGVHKVGCILNTIQLYGFGYYEAKIWADNGSNVWNAFWWEGMNAQNPGSGACGTTFATGSAEVDFMESFGDGAASHIHMDGYGTCETTVDLPNGFAVTGQYHVVGVDIGDNNSITFYDDGSVVNTYSPSTGVGSGWTAPITINNSAASAAAVTSNGMKVAWVRWYHH